MKQAIILRNDIKMGKGKLVAQGAHASVSAALKCMNQKKEWFKKWINEGQKKIALKVKSEAELKELFEKTKKINLPAEIIIDAGLTQLEPGTITALAIGPAPDEDIDLLTKHLKLL